MTSDKSKDVTVYTLSVMTVYDDAPSLFGAYWTYEVARAVAQGLCNLHDGIRFSEMRGDECRIMCNDRTKLHIQPLTLYALAHGHETDQSVAEVSSPAYIEVLDEGIWRVIGKWAFSHDAIQHAAEYAVDGGYAEYRVTDRSGNVLW